MRKKLALDDVQVESFITSEEVLGRGTVRGRESFDEGDVPPPPPPPPATEAFTCTCKSEVTWIGPPAACCAF